MPRKTITLVTTNEDKLNSFRNAATGTGIEFETADIHYPEDHDSNSTEDIAEKGAKYCFQQLGRPVIVTDIGLFIDSLNGFPGVNTGFVLNTIGNEGILKLVEQNRNAEFRLSIGYCDSERNFSVTASTEGRIAEEKRGDGFGFDPIFIPKDLDETFGENTEMRDKQSPRSEAIRFLLENL